MATPSPETLGIINMKTAILISALTILVGCNYTDKEDSRESKNSSITSTNDTSKEVLPKVNSSKLTSRQYANGLISGQIQPGENAQIFAWLDSLQSANKSTRDLAFQVYKAIVLKSDGAVSEAICGFIKSYFLTFPKDFLDNYATLNDKQKIQTQDNIAFEFYASGTDFKKDIEEYFMETQNNCKECSSDNNLHFEDIRIKVETKVRQMAD